MELFMKFREIKELSGLSNRKFGEYYNIPRRTIEDWNCGLKSPPEYVLALLERAVREDFPEKKA